MKDRSFMSLNRRSLLAGGAAALLLPKGGFAADWPTKSVRVIIPFAPGGTTDLLGRLAAQRLSEELKQQFVPENKAGAGGNIGGDIVAKAPPDGYTLLVGTPGPHVINQYIYKEQPFDGAKDLAPIIVLGRVPNLITVHPDVKANTLKELIELAKAQPGKVTFATPGNGSTGHVAGELLKSMAGINLTHVPYNGTAPAITDVVGGRVNVSIDNMPPVLPQVQAGKLRALAVTTTTRWPDLPDVPTVAEAGVPGYEASAWFTLAAPTKTPADVIKRMNDILQVYLKNPETVAKLKQLGVMAVGGSPQDMAKLIEEENVKWKKVIEFAGLKPQ